jgi:AbrB family looped-hinge helix DNA binding protein
MVDSHYMKVTIDRVGRIVIPKGLRDQLGLRADEELEASIDGHAIRLEPRLAASRVVVDRNGLAVLRAVGDLKLTDRMVRDLRDAEQR